MEEVFFSLPNTLPEWGAVAVVIITGTLAAIRIFDRDFADTKRRKDELEKDIISAYEKKTKVQDDKITVLEGTLANLRRDMDLVLAENRTFRDLLVEKDKLSADYRSAGMAAIKQNNEIYTLVRDIHSTMNSFIRTVTKLIEAQSHPATVVTTKEEKVVTSMQEPVSEK